MPEQAFQLGDSWAVDTDEDGFNNQPSASQAASARSSRVNQNKPKQRVLRPVKPNNNSSRSIVRQNTPSESEVGEVLSSSTSSSRSFTAPDNSPSRILQRVNRDDNPSRPTTTQINALNGEQPGNARSSQRDINPSVKRRRRKSHSIPGVAAEPTLIMPSLHEDNLGSLWLGEDRSKHDTGTRKSSTALKKPRKRDGPEKLRSKSPIARTVQDRGAAELLAFLEPILYWVRDVVGGALSTLKRPISYLLAAYVLAGLLFSLRNLLTNSVSAAFSPLCRIPGSSFLHLPMCHAPVAAQYESAEPPLVQFDQLMNAQSKFEAVLEESAGGVSLPLDMKRGEASIRDLRQVVRHSGLRSKNELVLEFDGFIETARIASYDLQKFNSHIGRGVDNILATARWTKRVLDGIAYRDKSIGTISTFFTEKVLAPFQPLKFTEDVLLDQYIQHTRMVEDEIHRLISEAQALLLILQNLEDRLDVIHGIAVRDDIHAQSSKAEVLSQIWTMVGGNRGKLGKFDSELRLLRQVDSYRRSAIAHVSGTMVKLQGIGTELEELRERVGGVELLEGSGVPLSVHIENIELGVERLEKSRDKAKEVEGDQLEKTMNHGKIGMKGIEQG